ncbi:hypothetical protein PRIC2_011840 [Phytophthora ramorum]
MGKKAKRGNNTQLQTAPSKVESPALMQTQPPCDQAKLRTDLTAYMGIANALRAKRSEIYEADRRGKLKDPLALEMSLEVAKLKRSGDKLRLAVCEQLRVLIKEAHHYLEVTSKQTLEEKKKGSTETNSKFSLELADKCAELLHSITFTAIKEEIFEKERLMRNVRLHGGRSSVYIEFRSRWRVRPRSW